MHQAIVTIILGALGTWLAQWLIDIHKTATRNDPDGLTAWLTNFSNGDVLAFIQILLLLLRLRQSARHPEGAASFG